MNADQIEILGTLRGKIKIILSRLESEKEKSEQLEKEFQDLKLKYNEKVRKLEETEQKYNNLKMAKVILDKTEDGHDARIKVNRIVREIDKCIALLNR